MITRSKQAWLAAPALAAGLLLRVAFLHWRPEVSGDSLLYGDIAQNLLHHHVYGLTQGTIQPTYIRLPGYPLMLAACFAVFGDGNYGAVLWGNVVLDLATCCLVGALAWRRYGARAGLAALWLAALCPFTANYCAAPLTETPSLFCVALAFFALERVRALGAARAGWRWGALAGLACAAAVLLRPEQGLLSVAVIPSMLWPLRTSGDEAVRRPGSWAGVVPATIVCALVGLPLLVWGVRNARVMGQFQPLAPRSATDPGEPVPDGFNHWFRTWGIDFASTYNVYWNYDGAGIEFKDLPARAMDDAEQPERTEAIVEQYNKTQKASAEVDAALEQLARERDAAHPLRSHVLLPVARVADMWLRPRTELMDAPMEWWRWQEHPGVSVAEVLYALLNAAFLAAGVAGAWRCRPQWTALEAAMVAFVLLRTALLLTLDNSEPRYTLECFPVLFVFAGVLWRGGGPRERSRPLA